MFLGWKLFFPLYRHEKWYMNQRKIRRKSFLTERFDGSEIIATRKWLILKVIEDSVEMQINVYAQWGYISVGLVRGASIYNEDSIAPTWISKEKKRVLLGAGDQDYIASSYPRSREPLVTTSEILSSLHLHRNFSCQEEDPSLRLLPLNLIVSNISLTFERENKLLTSVAKKMPEQSDVSTESFRAAIFRTYPAGDSPSWEYSQILPQWQGWKTNMRLLFFSSTLAPERSSGITLRLSFSSRFFGPIINIKLIQR